MAEREFKSCCVVNQFCKAWPGQTREAGWRSLTTECFVCGEPVCTNCSSIRQYLPKFGKVRMCDRCQGEWDGHEDRVMLRIYHRAGYKGPLPEYLRDRERRRPGNPALRSA